VKKACVLVCGCGGSEGVCPKPEKGMPRHPDKTAVYGQFPYRNRTEYR